MSDNKKRLEKQAHIARIIQHPKANEIIQSAAASGADSDQLKLAKEGLKSLSWDDLFEPIKLSNGEVTYLYDNSSFWRNWNRATDAVDKMDDLTAEMLLKRDEKTGKRPLDYAVEFNAAQGLMAEKLWRHDPFSFEKIFFNLPGNMRMEVESYNNVRKSIYKHCGLAFPDQKYLDKSMTLQDVIQDIRSGRVEDLFDNLDKAGINPDKELVLGPDTLGDVVFSSSNHWDYFPETVEHLRSKNVSLSLEDYTRELTEEGSLLSHAIKTKRLDALFAPEVWVHQLDDMAKLYKMLPDPSVIDFETLFIEAASLTMQSQIVIDDSLTVEKLLTPIEFEAGEKPYDMTFEMTLLQQDLIWDEFDKVYEILKSKGEYLSLETLRESADQAGRSYLHLAARGGAFGTVMEMLTENGEEINASDLLMGDINKVRVLDDLADQDQLRDVFQAKYWVGKHEQVQEIYDALYQGYQDSVHWKKLEGQINILQLRNYAKSGGASVVALEKKAEKKKDQPRPTTGPALKP